MKRSNDRFAMPLVGLDVGYFADCTREDLIRSPLFTSFDDSRMSKTNALDFADEDLRAKMLGDAIPAESFAAGANATGGLSDNYDMQSQAPLNWSKKSCVRNVWEHSDIKNVAYYFTHLIFEKIRDLQ